MAADGHEPWHRFDIYSFDFKSSAEFYKHLSHTTAKQQSISHGLPWEFFPTRNLLYKPTSMSLKEQSFLRKIVTAKFDVEGMSKELFLHIDI